MSFGRILGQAQPKQTLKNALQNNSVAHAYLFYGQESIGKKYTAIELAKAMNCSESLKVSPATSACPAKKSKKELIPISFL